MSANTGGPAFPRPFSGKTQYAQEGMTLRDYFAAKAMMIFLANDETDWDDDVRDAYAVADKMLAERAK